MCNHCSIYLLIQHILLLIFFNLNFIILNFYFDAAVLRKHETQFAQRHSFYFHFNSSIIICHTIRYLLSPRKDMRLFRSAQYFNLSRIIFFVVSHIYRDIDMKIIHVAIIKAIYIHEIKIYGGKTRPCAT